MVKVEAMEWSVLEIFPEHGSINVEFRAQGKTMKWYIPWTGTEELSALVNVAAPLAAAAIAKQLEPDPTMTALLGKKGTWSPSVKEEEPVE